MTTNLKTAALLAAGLLMTASTQAMAASAEMKNAEGKSVGTIEVEAAGDGVKLSGSLSGLEPGEHAFHIHETGECEAPDFKSAGAHYAPGGTKHGKVEGGPHAGDMPNITVGENGKVKISETNDMVTLEEGGKNSLMDEDGSALVVHAKPDDYKSQPSGAAGDRVACGVIEQ